MRVFDLDQGSQEWLTWRESGIGASDAACVLGIDPYKTKFELWQEKTGRNPPQDLSRNPNIIRGHKLEPVARANAERHYSMSFEPLCASSADNRFVLASFDGVSPNRKILLEIKCPHPTTFEDIKTKKTESTSYRMYWVQVQQQLYVSNAEYAYLFFFLAGTKTEKPKAIQFKIYPDETFFREKLIPELTGFWKCVETDTPPTKDSERDVCDIDDSNWQSLAENYLPIKAKVNELERLLKAEKARAKNLEDQFIDILGDKAKADESGIKVSRIERKQAVNYEAIVDDLIKQLEAQNVEVSKEDMKNQHLKPQAKPGYRFTLSDTQSVETPKIEIKEPQAEVAPVVTAKPSKPEQKPAYVGWF